MESLLHGPAATALLRDDRFLSQWGALLARCPHATAYQSPGFLCAWYAAYASQWQPVIALARDGAGELDGLWLLAYDSAARNLAHAGTHQAEYQTWLAAPGADAAFIEAAWSQLKRELEFATLSFKFLPRQGLAETLSNIDGMRHCIHVRSHRRPLLTLDADAVKASFAKKSNKSRVNRLKRLGTVAFRKVTDPIELDRIFDTLIGYYDFRQGAVNSSVPFQEDPYKRDFHRELLRNGTSGAYITVTFLDEEPIAAFWGADSGDTVHLGMLFYSPFLAEHSPGKLHIMDLSLQLLRDGKSALDLTPGGDAWKDRFANDHDIVLEVTVHVSAMNRKLAAGKETVLRWGRRCVTSAGLSPAQLKSLAAKLPRVRISSVLRKLTGWINADREFRVYRANRALAGTQRQQDTRVQRNALPDLLAFQPGESWQSRDGFLSSALSRLEHGTVAYTVAMDNRLAHVGWLAHGTTSYMTEVGQSITFPPGSVAFFDFYSHPDFRGRGLYRTTIRHMLGEAFADDAVEYAYISVLADNGPSRHVIETLGFEYQGSFHWQRRFGKVRKWASPSFTSSEVAHA